MARELYGVPLHTKGEAEPLSMLAIQQCLVDSEDYYSRALSLQYKPTRVFSDTWGRQHQVFPDSSVAALPDDYDEVKDLDEPGYDYTTDYWHDERWGFLLLNRRPVLDITQVFFAFPGVNPVFTVPTTWIRPDRKMGLIQIVPSSTAAVLATLTAYVLGVLAGGRSMPQAVYVDYVAGLNEAEWLAHHSDLLQAIKLRAMVDILGIVATAAAPSGVSSSSLSIDGLARSRSWGGKFGPYSGRIEMAVARETELMESWRRRERPPTIGWA